jgi:hypothetical protein
MTLKFSRNLLLALGMMSFLGCEGTASVPEDGADRPASSPAAVESHADHDHQHAHPEHGPHQGELIELGNEEYHAELMHADESVTIYILDSSAAKVIPISAREVTINLKHEGKPKQFQLVAAPEANDPEGKSSKFISNDAELAGHLDDEDADARLVVEIEGKSYRGNLAHEHHEHAE